MKSSSFNDPINSGLFQSGDEITISHLMDSVMSKNPNLDASELRFALDYTIRAHRNQFRKSGMPYAEHPYEVSKLLAEYQVDTKTVIAGLLHDVVEDTSISIQEIQEHFGDEVAFMVDAVTKITHIQESEETPSKDDQMAATYRKLIVSMAKDPRVLMIKIADRLHNMRTLHYITNDVKKKRISQETIDVYAPLSHRFGLNKIKSELEDLSFKYLNPEIYRSIIQQLNDKKDERQDFIQNCCQVLEKFIDEAKVQAAIQGRPKNIYSIYNKIKHRKFEIDNIYDVFALRVICEDDLDCYKTLGIIHRIWPPLQSRFKDYIATPKNNLYQSLHTTVLGPHDKLIEIQIRTKKMNEIAERGFASHWKYKSGDGSEKVDWLQEIAEIQKEITDSNEFLEFFKVDLKPKDLVAFTPSGDAVTLPHGASILDFAYAVHSSLGDQCIGARIENQFVPLHKSIPYGATVKILKNQNQRPSREWLNFAKTNRAKSCIRKSIRFSEIEKIINLGKTLTERLYKQLNLTGELRPKTQYLQDKFSVKSDEEFYEKIGLGELPIDFFKHQLQIDYPNQAYHQEALLINHDNIALVNFSDCCAPLPGDPLLGSFNPGQGIFIHHFDCSIAQTIKQEHPEEIIPLLWLPEDNTFFEVGIEVHALDRDFLLRDITEIFQLYNISIVRASIDTISEQVRNNFQIKVHGLSQLNALIKKLEDLPNIQKVIRL
jgi:GTP diphosphokinase / guanosine-3',5'-bis(diphosphate) 3'-diphosphatase